jgi:hypothetical protein
MDMYISPRKANLSKGRGAKLQGLRADNA